MNGQVSILRGDDVDHLPLKISALTISVNKGVKSAYKPSGPSGRRLSPVSVA